MQRLADERAAIERDREARLAAERACRASARATPKPPSGARLTTPSCEFTPRGKPPSARPGCARPTPRPPSGRARCRAAAEREAGERALRREAIARQRPRWMVARHARGAGRARLALAVTAVAHEREAEPARARARPRNQQRDRRSAEARRDKDELARLDGRSPGCTTQIDRAVDPLAAAKTEADRKRRKRRSPTRSASSPTAAARARRRSAATTKRFARPASTRASASGTALGCIDWPAAWHDAAVTI